MSAEIGAGAHRLATATADLEGAQAALAEKQAAAGRIHGRRDALMNERAAIIAAARNGVEDQAGPLRLAVLDADLTDLKPALDAAVAEVRQAETAVAQARNAVAQAETALQLDADRDFEAKLVQHAVELDRLLVATLGELAALQRRRGGRPAWGPSDALARDVARLRLVAQNRAVA